MRNSKRMNSIATKLYSYNLGWNSSRFNVSRFSVYIA